MGKKLRPKYTVQRIREFDSPGGPVTPIGKSMLSTDSEDTDSPFVLMPRKDPAAFAAMLAYSMCCEPDLAVEIRDWLVKIAGAEPKYGTQGTRNRMHMKKEMVLETMRP